MYPAPELCRLLLQQLGRMPSLSELYAAMGMGQEGQEAGLPQEAPGMPQEEGTPSGGLLDQLRAQVVPESVPGPFPGLPLAQPVPSGPAGPQDGPLTALLRREDAMSQQMVRMLLLGSSGQGAHLSPTLRLPNRPRQGPMHLRPMRGLSLL